MVAQWYEQFLQVGQLDRNQSLKNSFGKIYQELSDEVKQIWQAWITTNSRWGGAVA